MSSVGPCNVRFEAGWPCGDDFLPCFKDCCQRGEQFCHLGTRRCQYCHTRVGQCGNASLPWECDAFCLRELHMDKTSEGGVEGVSPVYLYTTLVLAPLVVLLLGLLARDCFRQKRARTASSSHLSDQVSDGSTSGLMLVVDETSEKSAVSSAGDTGIQTDQNGGDNTILDYDIPPSESQASPSNTTPPTATLRPVTRQSFEGDPISGSLAFSTLISTSQENVQLLAGNVLSQTAPTSSENHSVCRDPRLNNIIPTSDDKSRVPVVHTGHVHTHPFTADQ